MYCKEIAYKSLASNGPHLWKEFPQLFWAPITRLLAICKSRVIMSSPPHWAISYCNRLIFRLSFSHFWSCTCSPVTISTSDKSGGSALWLHVFSSCSKVCQIQGNSNAYLSLHMSVKYWVAHIPQYRFLCSSPNKKLQLSLVPPNFWMQLFHLIFFSLCICLFTKLGECFCINTLDTDGQSWQALRFFKGEKSLLLVASFLNIPKH